MFFNIYFGDFDSHIIVTAYIPVNTEPVNHKEITICGFRVAYNDSLVVVRDQLESGWMVPRDDPRYERAGFLIKRILCTPTLKQK